MRTVSLKHQYTGLNISIQTAHIFRDIMVVVKPRQGMPIFTALASAPLSELRAPEKPLKATLR